MAKLMVDGMEVGGTFTSGESGSTNASDHIYDNTNSENITSETVQGAIDELDKRISEQVTLGKINDSNKLVESTDLNDILEVGQYYISTDAIAETCKNMPIPLAGTVVVGDSTNNHASVDGAFDRIVTYTTRTNETYTRYVHDDGTIATYSDWTKLVTANELTDMTEGVNNKSDIALINQTLGYTKKNLLKNTAVTTTIQGITFTVNDDGSVTANGTAAVDETGNSTVAKLILGTIELKKGMAYIVSGCPSDGGKDIYRLILTNDGKGVAYDYGNGVEYISSEDQIVNVRIDIVAGTTVENLTFYPMIRSADIEDDTYEPYVEDVKTTLNNIGSSLSNLNVKVESFDESTATLYLVPVE